MLGSQFLCSLCLGLWGLRPMSEGMRSHPLWIKTGSLACPRSLARALPCPPHRGVAISWGPLEEPEAAGGRWLTGSPARPATLSCCPRKREHPARALKSQQGHNPAQSLGKGSGWWDGRRAGPGQLWVAVVGKAASLWRSWDPSPTPSPALSCAVWTRVVITKGRAWGWQVFFALPALGTVIMRVTGVNWR